MGREALGEADLRDAVPGETFFDFSALGLSLGDRTAGRRLGEFTGSDSVEAKGEDDWEADEEEGELGAAGRRGELLRLRRLLASSCSAC